MRKLAAYPRQNELAAALREVGRVERSLFMIDWATDPDKCAGAPAAYLSELHAASTGGGRGLLSGPASPREPNSGGRTTLPGFSSPTATAGRRGGAMWAPSAGADVGDTVAGDGDSSSPSARARRTRRARRKDVRFREGRRRAADVGAAASVRGRPAGVEALGTGRGWRRS